MFDAFGIEEKEVGIEKLKEIIPQLTRRQIECWLLCFWGFTQEESGEILGIAQQVIQEHLGKVWDKLV